MLTIQSVIPTVFTSRYGVINLHRHESLLSAFGAFCSALTLFRLGAYCAPYRFFPYCAETVCSRLMKLSDS